VQIIPTLLTTDLQQAEQRLRLLANIFKIIQIDVLDGIFAPQLSLAPNLLSDLTTLSSFQLDFHLMTDNPIFYLPACFRLKPKQIIGHIELMPSQKLFISELKKNNIICGLALDLPTPIESLDKNIINELDIILVMSVKTGKSGQSFNKLSLQKVKDLVKIRKEHHAHFEIALDGGINIETIKPAYQAGAEIFYVGSFLDLNPKQKLQQLTELLND